MRFGRFPGVAAVWCVVLSSISLAAAPGKLTVNVAQPGAKIDPIFYGLMTEEINHAYDGGLYAELIQNRIFQDNREQPAHWSVVKSEGADGKIALDSANPVNNGALKTSLRLDVTSVANGQRVGVANGGYWGIPVWPNTKYHATFYARGSDDFSGPLTVSIESNDGATTFASAKTASIGKEWKKYEADLTTQQVQTSTANRFVISGAGKGSVWLSLVSLFPPTYKNRANGNRVDLMQKMADLKPAFLRFPGGNYLEGNQIAERFDWKKTIGPLEDRPGHQCPWGYRSSDGLGLQEFLNWCEDLNMEPVLAVYAGYSLRGAYVKPGKDLEPYVQDAMDEIEYVSGDTSTKWGAVRAKNGHPEPYKLRYVEVGNEDFFDRSGSYEGRYGQFYDAIKAKYPNLQVIATTGLRQSTPDMVDDHAYLSSRAMLRAVPRYHDYDRSRPKIFFGEWATTEGRPTPTLRAAIADAAWMTGLQQDADVVTMHCYAPLLVNVNRGASQWGTNLIGYDAANSFGSASYYAQKMFSSGGWGDVNLPVDVMAQEAAKPTEAPMPKGFIGLGTWHTVAEFKDVVVTKGSQTLFKSDFSGKLASDWKNNGNGAWAVKDGALQQTNNERETWITIGDENWTDYTMKLKARKLSGDEGFLILFHGRDPQNYLWFNIGGWGNSRTAIEHASDGEKSNVGEDSDFTVQDNKWYDIKIELSGREIKCYIDDKPIIQATQTPPAPLPSLYAAASKVEASGEVILKVVNAGETPQQVEIALRGAKDVAKEARLSVMSGEPGDVNTVADPTKVAPKDSTISNAAANFTHEFPANSVSVIRLKAK